jgi:signal transduction histidine kinase
MHCAFFTQGYLMFITYKPVPEAHEIFKRFAKVFEQTYTRFLDLKRAEEQARESQIEAALEKVRSNSLAMHHSSELGQVVQSLFDRLTELGLLFDGALIFTFDKGKRNITLWIATNHLSAPSMIDLPYDIDYANNLILNDLWNANETGEHIINKSYSGEEKNNYFRYVAKHNDAKIPRSIQQIQIEAENWTLHCVAENHSMLAFDSWSGHVTTDEDFKILMRFARVFEQAYIRFLDLKKAEAQAREAQIEAALEKVRSCSLAMHKSEELQEVIRTVLARINDLGLRIDTGGIIIPFEDQSGVVTWLANTSFEYLQPFKVPWTNDLITKDIFNAYQNGLGYFSKSYSFEEKNEYYQNLFTYSDFRNIPDDRKANLLSKPKVAISYAGTSKTFILLFSYSGEVLPPEDAELIKRFARVFEQSYIRFLDLQKAEAQAREAQIEAALERVRSRAMAMHSSTELSDVVHELRKQMGMLGQKDLDTCVIHLNETSPDYIDAWAAIRPPKSEGEIIESSGRIPKKGLMLIEEALEAYIQNRKDYVIINEGEKIKQWFAFIQKEIPHTFDIILESTRDVPAEMIRSYWSFSDFPGGSLLMVTMDPPAETSLTLLRRFANVFGLAYRRFADLMTAEAQAREARIETSLERLRTKTMAMKNSDDVGDTVVTMFAELVQLGIQTSRCGILIFDDEEIVEVWTARSNADGKATLIIGELNLHAHDLIESGYYCWKEKQSSQSYFLEGKNLINYYDALNRSDFYPVKFDLNNLPSEEFNSKFFFPDGAVFSFTAEPMAEDQARIMGRFAAVFGQTYRRYLDLQKAEASAKEAIKQAALDRIRANIASMRTKQDLDRITPVIWNELTTLNIPFIRCGIFIINDNLQLIHTFLSNPEGKAIASFNLPFDSGKISDVVTHWRNNKNYVEHWKIGEFTAVADSLVQLGEIATREQYLESLPPGGIYLHFVPFLQGMLYAGNLTRLSDDDISLLQAVADAFSTAYARYEDFNKVENTLNDLRQTQKQLVQAEKMASLGELTAGIAHEIQNPLNFVNNFSSLNTELVAEGLEAISSGNLEDAEDILKTLAENSDKILQHGKRADAIVKGMLQHTRTSTGAKEPTDINALCDEYLRLAYHGLRAKDSTFNASMKTDFEENIGKVNIIPQDMGRVLLNLVNNAFYAVDEKKKKTGGSYEPEVALSTRMVSAPNPSIIVSVRDNGNGIPQKILDKIFQPFFTTKPTGQGTGLGLSLSYDIVKAHGGEIIVESKEGEGTIFSVVIPVG